MDKSAREIPAESGQKLVFLGHKPDPYCGFSDDVERRRALNTRVRWRAAAAVIVALATSGAIAKVPWVAHWLSQL